MKVVRERMRGTYGGLYIYVVEGNELVHISEYAITKKEHENVIIYEVPEDKLIGKQLYCFDFSRRGGAFLIKCEIEDFEEGHLKRGESGLLSERFHEIRDLKFRIKDPELQLLLTQFNAVIKPMIRELKEYESIRNFRILFRHEERLSDAFSNPDAYYFTFMSLPNDRSRINSFKVTRRWIYQLWILKLLCDALEVSKFKWHEYEGKPYWRIEQGSEFSTCIAETCFGDITFWLEFQPSKGAHMIGIVYPSKKRIPVRPDIVVVRGYFESVKAFLDSGKPIDLLIECKEAPYDEWRNEIDTQILDYLRKYKPKNFIVASLEAVLDSAKMRLEHEGIKVIDKLKPGNENIKTLYETVKKALK